MTENMNKYQTEFIDFYDKQADLIFRFCYFKVYDRELAKELVQETFLKTWEYLAAGREVGNLKAFLYKVARNLIIDGSRKKKEEKSLEELQEQGFEPGIDSDQLEKVGLDMEMKNALRHLQKVEPMYQEVIIMRYVNDLGPKEIAEALGESENVVSVRINRGIKKLRVLLKGE